MIEKYIAPGQKLELKALKRVKLGGDNAPEKTYSSKVYDIISDDRLEILMPIEQTKLILLPVDAEYELYFYTAAGLYECVCRIIDRYKSNNVYILLVELETNLRKFQRREYYRYSCALDMDTRALLEEEVTAVDNNQNYIVPGLPLQRSVIVDISGGGLIFVSAYKYDKGCVIFCKYTLMIRGEDKVYQIPSKILDVREVDSKKGMYEHRVQYINLDNDVREEIIQFIFEEERKNRHKERGF